MVGQCDGCHQRGRPKRKWLESVMDAIREEGQGSILSKMSGNPDGLPG